MKNIYITLICSSLIFTLGCDDLLDTEPNDRISNENALSDYEGMVAVLLGGYDELRNNQRAEDEGLGIEPGNVYYRRDFIIIAEALADNLKQPLNNTSRLLGVSENMPYSHFDFWEQAYKVINAANLVIQAVGQVEHTSQEALDQLHGEALFLRALAHFDLVRAYARNPNYPVGEPMGVPLITEISSPTKTLPTRSTIAQVYDQVIDDLTKALDLINASPAFPNRANVHAAQALLARVHLYAGNWQQAEDAATAVIANIGFDIEMDNYLHVFAEQSETIFGLSFTADENPALNGSLQGILYVDPAINIGYGDFVARQELIDLYDVADIRHDLLIAADKSGEAVTYIGKFLGYAGEFGNDHIPLIRLSEMYLTRAEARAEIGTNLAGAVSDLNKIRNRAGLGNTTATSQGEILDAVLLERRLELAFEGHRIFDLKRRGLNIPKGISEADCQGECSIPYTDYRVIANIPQRETDVNQNLKQNPSY